ncbi:MAG: GerMN domain-containing protein [Nitrospirota bacterium]
MRERLDRVVHDRLMLAAGIVIITIAVAAGGYLGWRMSTPSALDDTSSFRESQSQDIRSRPLLAHDEPLTVTIWYPHDATLATGPLTVKRQTDTRSQARETILGFLADERIAQAAILKDIRLQELYLDVSGTAYLDIATVQNKDCIGSVREELSAVYALVNTVIMNFEDIKQVSFLINGKESKTLAGHLDLTKKFGKRPDFIHHSQ